ncbi:MAG TPA: AAA family ATPase [Acidobacteriota bacterium]|nr:AAA family ATPase [Acidobacteriota bacterium]
MIEVQESIDSFQGRFQIVRDEIGKVIVGNDEVIVGILTALLAGGHALLEGIPGLGKTKLVHTLADVLHLDFHRIQFTPDLMPADIVGTNVVHETPDGARHLDFQPGPIFANIVLADEINRATPKTQSALLEAMQENSVSVGRETYPLSQPFFVLATQNPLEMEGTYPLPEAQLDRFLFKLKLDFPSVDNLHEIMERTTQAEEPTVTRVLDGEQIVEMRKTARAVPISKPVQDYAIRLTLATHPGSEHAVEETERYVRYGAGPRAIQTLVLAGKIRALLHDRVHVAAEDIRATVMPALRHRVLLNFEGEADRVDTDTILAAILESLPGPGD